MNEVIFITGDKFLPAMHLKQPEITYSTCGPFTKNKEKILKDLKKQEVQNRFTKTNYKKLDFYMIWLMEILKI